MERSHHLNVCIGKPSHGSQQSVAYPLQPILAVETNVELVSKIANKKALSFEGPSNFLEFDENNATNKVAH